MFKKIGQQIRKARKNKHLTQYQLAEILDTSESFVSRLERGEISTTLERLQEIAQALDVGLETLLSDFVVVPHESSLDPILIELGYPVDSFSADQKTHIKRLLRLMLQELHDWNA